MATPIIDVLTDRAIRRHYVEAHGAFDLRKGDGLKLTVPPNFFVVEIALIDEITYVVADDYFLSLFLHLENLLKLTLCDDGDHSNMNPGTFLSEADRARINALPDEYKYTLQRYLLDGKYVEIIAMICGPGPVPASLSRELNRYEELIRNITFYGPHETLYARGLSAFNNDGTKDPFVRVLDNESKVDYLETQTKYPYVRQLAEEEDDLVNLRDIVGGVAAVSPAPTIIFVFSCAGLYYSPPTKADVDLADTIERYQDEQRLKFYQERSNHSGPPQHAANANRPVPKHTFNWLFHEDVLEFIEEDFRPEAVRNSANHRLVGPHNAPMVNPGVALLSADDVPESNAYAIAHITPLSGQLDEILVPGTYKNIASFIPGGYSRTPPAILDKLVTSIDFQSLYFLDNTNLVRVSTRLRGLKVYTVDELNAVRNEDPLIFQLYIRKYGAQLLAGDPVRAYAEIKAAIDQTELNRYKELRKKLELFNSKIPNDSDDEGDILDTWPKVRPHFELVRQISLGLGLAFKTRLPAKITRETIFTKEMIEAIFDNIFQFDDKITEGIDAIMAAADRIQSNVPRKRMRGGKRTRKARKNRRHNNGSRATRTLAKSTKARTLRRSV